MIRTSCVQKPDEAQDLVAVNRREVGTRLMQLRERFPVRLLFLMTGEEFHTHLIQLREGAEQRLPGFA